MRPDLNKFIPNHESNQEETFIPSEAIKNKGVANPTPNSFIDSLKSSEDEYDIGDMLRRGSVQGVKNTGETKFMDIEQYRKYSDRKDGGVSNFAFGANHELSRALNQSNWEQTGHVVAKFLPNTALEIIGMAGNILDVEDYKNSDNEVGNWLNIWAQEQKEEINKALPIYRENPSKPMDIGDYAWWMENGGALAESATAFVALGFATGAGSLAALTRSGQALKWLQTLGKTAQLADTGKKVVQGAAGLANTAMLNQAEGVGIAVQVYQQTLDKTIAELKKTNPELGDEQIMQMSKDKAAKNASKALNFNRMNMILNATSAFAFLRTPALTRQIRNSPALKNTLRRSGLEGLQESGEELVNLASENYGMDGESRKFEDAFRDTFTMEGLEAGFLGFIGGAAQTGLISAGKELKTNKRPDGSRYSENDMLRERAIEQEEAKQRWEGLSQEEKLTSTSDLFMTAKQLTELKNEIDKIDVLIAEAREKGDIDLVGKLQLKAQELAKDTFNSKAFHAFSTGTTEQLEDFYKGVATLTSEEAEAKGLNPDTYKDTVDHALVRIKELEKAFNLSNAYLDSSNIYSNRAKLSDLRSQEEPLKTALNDAYDELGKDLNDLLGYEDIPTNDKGEVDISKMSKENQSVVKDLESYSSVLAYKNLLNLNKQRKERLTKEFSNLISNEYQKAFKESLREKKQTTKTNNSKAKANTKKDEASEKANATKKGFKEQTPPPTNTGEESSTTSNPVVKDDGDKFSLPISDEYNDKLVEFVNSPNLDVNQKINTINQQLAKETDKPTIDSLTAALDYIQDKNGIAPQQDVQKNSINKQINDIATTLEDLSPTQENPESKTFKKIRMVVNLMESLDQRGVDTKDFGVVAKYLQNVLGKERFAPLFNDIKDVYNLAKINDTRITASYEDIFYTAEDKKEAIANEEVVQDASLPEGFYNYSNEEINELSRQARIGLLKDQGYSVYKSDTIAFEGLRTEEGHNKLAHRDKQYQTNVRVSDGKSFNVLNFIHTKSDIANFLDGSTDEALLDYDQLNVGDEVTFVVLDKVYYDDGTIVYKNGTVEKNGDKILQDPNEIAPIGVKLNGILLDKVFLHTTEWINTENIAHSDDVKNQKNKLYEIRKKVIEAGQVGITTKVTSRGHGFVMQHIDGEQGTITERLPNAKVAIAKNNTVLVGNKQIPVINKELWDGVSYVVFPVNKGKNLAMPVDRVQLSEKREYIDSMLEAVRLYLANDPFDERAVQLFDQTNIDITTEAGLREYLGKFIFLPNDLPYSTADFSAYMLNQKESVSIVRVVGENLEFGRGAGVGKGVRILNRKILAGIRKEEGQKKMLATIEGVLSALDNTLSNNMSINISKNKMGKDFTLPIITKDTVNTTEMKYDNFVKDHLTTDLYSHTLSNGKEIYTIQAQIEFDDSFAFNGSSAVNQEVVNEALGTTETEITEDVIKVTHKGKTFVFNPDEDLSPTQIFNVAQEVKVTFSDNPQLKSIGTKQQYSEYLKTIFPDSQVQDILYHGGNEGIERFEKDKLGETTGAESAKLGFFFSNNKELSTNYITKERYKYIGEYEKYLKAFTQELDHFRALEEAQLKDWKKLYDASQNFINKLLDLVKKMFNNGYITTIEQRDAADKKLKEIREKVRELELKDYATRRAPLSEFVRDSGLSEFDNATIEKLLIPNKKLYTVKLNLKNPATYDNFEDYREDGKFYSGHVQESLDKGYDGTILKNVVDITNHPLGFNIDGERYRSEGITVNDYFKGNDYVAFDADQIHILGSKKDIEGFKSFIKEDLSPTQLNPNQVQYNLKSYNILTSDKAKQVFEKGKKNKWNLDKIFTELQIPKEQKGIVKDIYDNLTFVSKDDNGNDVVIEPTIDELILDLASKYSYTVEVNTAKETAKGNNRIEGYNTQNVDLTTLEIVEDDFGDFMVQDKDGKFLTPIPFKNKEEAQKAINNLDSKPSQYYNNLTVPGGTNYTENEIATPLITPAIKGHAQFSTDKGIGWFRSDDKANTRGLTKEQIANIPEEYKQEALSGTKTRRILELQSDLFQKGRDRKDLVNFNDAGLELHLEDSYEINRAYQIWVAQRSANYYGVKEFEGDGYGFRYISYDAFPQDVKDEIEALRKQKIEDANKTTNFVKESPNQFLQLLNNKGNWVNFFIKSIVQDSIKKGYKTVLFPKGETAAKIEGHDTLANNIKEDQDKIKDKQMLIKDMHPEFDAVFIRRLENEIGVLEEGIKATKEQGIEKLKPIEAFYENRVSNILNKEYKDKVKVITDEYGNQWNEVTLDSLDNSIDLSPLQLTKQQVQLFEDTTPSSLLIQGVPIKTQTILIDYLSAEVIKSRNNKPIQELYGLLNAAVEAYTNELTKGTSVERNAKLQKGIDVMTAVLNNYNKISALVNQNLLTFNALKYKNGVYEVVETNEDLENESEENDDNSTDEIRENDKNNWAEDSTFQVDTKRTAGTNVKLALAYVEDVERIDTIDGVKTPITKTPVFGLPAYKLYDEIINEISGILAFSNYDSPDKITQANLESILKTLESWVDTKSYLYNVIEKIKAMDTPTQNMFVGVMSKHYTHHALVFKNAKGNYYINNSDSNNIAAIVQNGWLQNLINSDLIIPSDTTYILSETQIDLINEKVATFVELIKSDEEVKAIKLATNILNEIGIDLDEDTVRGLVRTPINYGKGPQSLLALFTTKGAAIEVYLKELNKLKGKDIQENHPFQNNSSLSAFAKEIAKRNPVYFSASFKDVRGRTYYSYSANKFFTDRFKRLKTDVKLLKQLAKQPFSYNSSWVKQMIDNPDHFFRYFKYNMIDGRKEGKNGKKLTQMSPAEHEETKVAYFFSQNRIEGKDYIINVFYPTTSDKGLQPTIGVLGTKFSKHLKPTTGKLTDKAIDYLYNALVQPEINRIMAFERNPSKFKTKGYNDGALTFNMIPSLNTVDDVFIVEDGVRFLNPEVNTNEADVKTNLKVALRKYIEELVSDKIATWKDYGFIEEIENENNWDANQVQYTTVSTELSILRNKSKDKYVDGVLEREIDPNANASDAAHNYVLNYLVANANIYQTMTTDPANFFKSDRYEQVIDRLVEAKVFETSKGLTRADVLGYYELKDFITEHEDTYVNMGKRLAADIAPGTDPAFEPNTTFNVAHIVDEESKSILAKDLEKLTKKDSYNKVNSTDAQEFTTLSEHLLVMFAKGDISKKKMNDILEKERKGHFISAKDLEIILQPMKPVYVNNIIKEDGTEHRVYIKSSAFPLIRQLTKTLEIDKLRKAMLRDNVDRVAFATAIKVGGTTEASIIYDDSSKGKMLDKIDLKPAILTLPREGFKIQQEVPYKETDKINDGTQQRKLLTAAIRHIKGFKVTGSEGSFTGQQIQDKLDETYNEIFKIKYDKLVEEIGYDSENNTITNLSKLQRILEEEGLSRGYPLYDLEGFKLDSTGNDFLIPLWMNNSASKIESMLNSIVDNRIRKFKPKGRSYVLGSSTGFRPTIIEGDEAAEEISNTSGIIFDKAWKKRGDGQLLPMRPGKNGEVLPAEVMIKPRMKDDKGNLIDINKFADRGYIDLNKLDSSILELFGFRIPTQGLNSMAYIKIVGFLPETSGDLFLAPADWTVQMGSDFDVDKIYTNSYNTLYNKETGVLSRGANDRLEELENYLLDLHFSILGNPDKEVQRQVLKPLDFGKLGEVIKEIYPQIQDLEGYKGGKGLSEEYQKFKYLNALAGKTGIGVFSNDSTFNALAQGKDIYLTTRNEEDKIVSYEFELGGKHSNSISEPFTNTRSKRTKSEVIAAYQSLSVDNENEQGMHKLNINSYTFDAIRTLFMHGFEEDIISYFISQPIVREYVKLKTLADDNSTNYDLNQLDEDLIKKYPLAKEDENTNLTLEALKAGISGKRNGHQQAALQLFLELTEQGKVIQTVQSAINTDSSGMGKNLFYSFEKEFQVLGLANRGGIRNADRLIGKYISLPYKGEKGILLPFDKSDVDTLIEGGYVAVTPINKGGKLASSIEFIKPETINGFASVYALMFNNRLWERFFPYNNVKLQMALNTIKSITNQTQARLIQNAELNSELFKDVKSFIIASQVSSFTDGELVAERKRLLVDIPDVNISLGNIVETIIKNGYSNPFLNRLNIDANKVILPTTVQYQASSTENIDERALYASFSEMINDDTTALGEFNGISYTPRKLAQDLITAQLISGGVQQANQYIKYIPMNYLHSIGFYDRIKNFDFYKVGQFDSTAYVRQYIQHNPEKVKLRKLAAYQDLGMIISEDKSRIVYNPTDQSSMYLPNMFSLKNSNRIKGYDLYTTSENAGEWNRISTLGYKDVTEFNPFSDNAKSIIPDNNSKFGFFVPELPTDPEEKKEFNRINTKKEIPEGSEVLNKQVTTVADAYSLKSNDTFVNKMTVVLDKIITDNRNPFNTLMAKEIAKNLNVLSDFNFILTNNLAAEGSHNLQDRTIKINLNNIDNNAHFENVILEELIHALTKPAIIVNTSGAVNRLNGLKSMATEAVRTKLGRDADQLFQKTIDKLTPGNPLYGKALLPYEYNIIYPLLNDTEFIGRLFKSKELQEILNDTPSDIEGKSIWGKFLDIISELLNSIGLDIKKDSALEYAMVDIISLINQESPSISIQGELKKTDPVYRTKEWIESNFKLKNEDGTNKTYLQAGEIADYINANYEGVQAIVVNNTVIIEYKYDNLLGEDLSPRQRKSDNIPLFRSYQDRLRTLNNNINKAKVKEDFAKVEQLTATYDAMNKRYQEAVRIGAKERLAQIAVKGKQDMAEVAEFFEGEITVEDTLYIRKILHFWETATDTLFDESERESEKLVTLFGEIEAKANYFSDKLVKIESDYMEDFMKKFGKATTIENVFTYFKDINYLQEKTMDISRIDNDLLSAVYLAVKEANIDATDEVKDITANLAELEKKVIKTLKAKGYKDDNLYDIFRQKTASGKLTGHIVSRYTRDFDKAFKQSVREVQEERTFSIYSNHMDWARNNTKVIKLGYLFSKGKFSAKEQEKVDAYKIQLEKELGTTHYNEFINAQTKKIEAYNRHKDNFIVRLMKDHNFASVQEVLNNERASKALTSWEKANSPYEYYKQLNGKTDQSLQNRTLFTSVEYIVPLPSKESSYDDNFKAIENDSTLYEFLQYYTEIDRQLKDFMPSDDKIKLAFSGIPHIEKAIFSAYNEKGMKAGLAPLWDEIKKSTRENPETDITSKVTDSVTGIEDKNLSTNLGRNNSKAYNDYIFNKSIEYLAKTGEDPSQEMINTWQEEIIDELAQKKSYDLPKVLRIYAMTVLAYKHKSKIEDSIKLAQNLLNQQQEVRRNNKGELQYTDDSRNRYDYLPVGESFVRTKKQFNHYVDALYGRTNQVELLDKKKNFTSEEKETIKSLEEKLELLEEGYAKDNVTDTEYITAKKKLEDQIDAEGGYSAWSKRGDMLLKYIQLKGMGWNVMSAIANIGFGTIANIIEGAGNQIYSGAQLRKGYRLTMGSIGRNAMFNHTSPGESKKIRNMMDKWDVLKDATHELYENPFTVSLSKKHKWLSPYNLTARTEYINQAPLMIALMLNTPVQNENGETTNLWDALDEAGNLKEGFDISNDKIKKLRIKIDQVIKRNHGNYDPNSPLALKRNWIGRAIGQFRTWMYEGFAARLESEKFDPALGITVKGRYRSVASFFGNDFSPHKVFTVLKALAKFQTFGMMFKETNFEQFGDPNDFKEVDVANMRRVVAEAVIYIDIAIAYMLLSMFAGSLDDEDDKYTKMILNHTINQGLRLRTDLTFYISPVQFKALLRDPLPVMSIVKDAGEWSNSVSRLIQGDDEIKSGTNAGTSRFGRETSQLMPFATQGYRIYNYGSQVFDKD